MSLFTIARIYLLISFLLLGCSNKMGFSPLTKQEAKTINSWQISPVFPCGIYILKGRLIESDGLYKIILREKTPTQLEFVLLGGSLDQRFSRLNTNVVVKVYNPALIEDRSNPSVYVKEYLQYEPEVPDYEIKEKKACKLSGEFVTPR